MQNSVTRDKDGHSQYAMVAVNPKRVHPFGFHESHLGQLIAGIRSKNNQLLQVVNYNVEHLQYVVAGEKGNLNTLQLVLDEIHQLLKKGEKDKVTNRQFLASLIDNSIIETERNCRDPETRRISLKRGVATIPLPGIDVPFHSEFLKDGVPAFRQILKNRYFCSPLPKVIKRISI